MTPERLKHLLVRCGVQHIIDRGTNFQACCPYHQENQPSWGISKTDPHLFGCFACHSKGSIVKLLVDKLDVTYTKAAQLAETKLSRVPARDLVLDQLAFDKLERLYETEELLSLLVPSPVAYRYLLRRGIHIPVARKADVRFDYNDSRVVFPWYIDRKPVGATGRSLNRDERAKTIPYGGMPKGEFLYFPRPPVEGRRLVFVEGEIDALKTAQALDNTYNIAALGFGVFTKAQQSLTLKIRPSEVICMFDFDPTGMKLTALVEESIGQCCYVKQVPWRRYHSMWGYSDDYKLDPAEVSDSAIRGLCNNARGSLSL